MGGEADPSLGRRRTAVMETSVWRGHDDMSVVVEQGVVQGSAHVADGEYAVTVLEPADSLQAHGRRARGGASDASIDSGAAF